jgi:hypothetical protein
MITLNTEHGFRTIRSWDDIVEQSGYVPTLDTKGERPEDMLKDVIGRYYLGNKIQCGLSTCRRPHFKGYIVSVKDGRITNIGKDCGTKYFGVGFTEMSRQLDKSAEEHENRDYLHSFKNKIPSIETQIIKLRTQARGADWAIREIKSFDNTAGTPREVLKELEALKRNGGIIYKDRMLTHAEIEDRAAIQSISVDDVDQYERIEVAKIAQVDVLDNGDKLRRLLAVDLIPGLSLLTKADIDSLNRKDLKELAKWASEVEDKFQSAIKIVANANRFFSAENLLPLTELVEDLEELTSFKSNIARASNA